MTAEAPSLTLPGRKVLRRPRFSGIVRVRSVVVCVVALVLLAGLVVVAVGQGSYQLSPAEVVRALLGQGTRAQQVVVLDLRMPRALGAVLVGIALGLAGALTQAAVRNPLASPDLLGVTDGAAVGAVFVIVVLGPGVIGVQLAAFLGAVLASVAIYLLAWRRGVDGFRFILVGLMVAEVLSGGVSWMLQRGDVTSATQAVIWLNGSLQNRGWSDVVPLALALVVLVPLAAATTFSLGGMQFGDDVGKALGVRLQRANLGVILAAVALSAFAVACAGPIGFVAFAAPQIAVRTCGGGRPPLLPSALTGAVLLVAADLLGRNLVPGRDLPVGLVTSAIGAPFLLWLLFRTNRKVIG